MKLLFYDMQIPDLLKDNGAATGGACVRQNAISKGLISLGHQVGILTWKGANAYVDKKVDVDLVESHTRKGGIPGLKYIYMYFYQTYKAVKGYEPDFLFKKALSVHNGIIALVAKLLGIPYVYLVANDKDVDERYKENAGFLIQRSYRYSLTSATAIVCQNSYQLAKIKDKYPTKKVMLMHNPYYNEDPLPSVRPRLERAYVAWIGIFSYQKNLPALYKIVKALPNVSFKIAGKQVNPLDVESQEALSLLKECPNVELIGFLKRSEIVNFLSKAYLLLNTSHFEGFSNTFLESFAAGTPVVTLENIDPDSIIANNNLGKTVAKYDHLPETINSLMHEQEFEEIANNCRRQIQTGHNPKLLSQKLIECLKAN